MEGCPHPFCLNKRSVHYCNNQRERKMIALEHGQVMRDPPRLQVWTNTKLAESWEDMAGACA